LGIIISHGIELKEYHFVATLTVPLSHCWVSDEEHLEDVGADLDRDASLAQ